MWAEGPVVSLDPTSASTFVSDIKTHLRQEAPTKGAVIVWNASLGLVVLLGSLGSGGALCKSRGQRHSPVNLGHPEPEQRVGHQFLEAHVLHLGARGGVALEDTRAVKGVIALRRACVR